MPHASKTVMFDNPNNKEASYFNGYYTHMLIEDVRNKVMPYRHSKYSIFLNNRNADESRCLAIALSQERSSDLSSAISNFCRMCAGMVIAHGYVNFELCLVSDGGFLLKYIPTGTIKKKGAKYIQYVPRSVAEKYNISERIIVDNVITVSLPKPYGPLIKRMMKHLDSLGSSLIPSRKISTTRNWFDFNKYTRTTTEALLSTTRILGWNRFLMGTEDILEYYELVRCLRFEKFIIELRTDIIDTLNKTLDSISSMSPFEGRIICEGLPTLDDVSHAYLKLESAQGTFKDVLSPFQR